jgi:hypothetical protein
MDRDAGLPIEVFIHALTSQLDRAQAAMAMKARAGLPLTFAVRDLTLDLRAHLEVVGSVVHLRPAAPDERDASTLHLSLTTITAPMIEENTQRFTPGEPSLREVLPDASDDEIRRLEWAGIQTPSQLLELERTSGEDAIVRVAQVPAAKLRDALRRATRPRVRQVLPELPPRLSAPEPAPSEVPVPERVPRPKPGDVERPRPRVPATPPETAPRWRPRDVMPREVAPREAAEMGRAAPPTVRDTPLLRIRGDNFVAGSSPPTVRIGGERVPVLHASTRELVVAPLAHQLAGSLTVETEPGSVAEFDFDLGVDESRNGHGDTGGVS